MSLSQLPAAVLVVLSAVGLLASCHFDSDSGPSGANERIFLGAGYSFGMCGGLCVGDLVIDHSRVLHEVHNHFDEEPLRRSAGELTPRALEILRGLLPPLAEAELQDIYGCPDCADGGAAYIAVLGDGALSRHAYDFGRPPDVLVDLNGFASAVISALESCRTTELVVVDPDCIPLE